MARRAIAQSLTRTALRAARGIGLTKALNRASRRLPRCALLWLQDRRIGARLRAGDTAGVVRVLGTLVDEDELKVVLDNACALLAERGDVEDLWDYLEFGVYVGSSMACMHEVLEQRNLDGVRLFGFDSFEGLPPDADSDDTAQIAGWGPGTFRAPFEACRANLSERGVDWNRTILVKGFFEDTLTPELRRTHGINKAGVIMVDCDLYSSARTALAFCAPLIGDHAVILFDDWWPETLGAARTGERRAFEEFLAANPELSAEELESYAPDAAKVFLISRSGPAA